MFSLYIHIPFCVRKCLYCDFLSAAYPTELRAAYAEALNAEIKREAGFYRNRRVNTIFFGGGTPTLLTEEQLEELMETVWGNFDVAEDAEISMEMNPGTADWKKLVRMRQLGINRLSIGLQAAEDELLQKLGRIHTWKQFEEAYGMARAVGFRNINVDIMSALPGQKLADYEHTLQAVLSFEPEHISAYSLILEEGTPFYEQRESLALPEEEEERQMYDLTEKLLRAEGYHRYEISNYAKDGYECRHNLAYWRRTDYAGFGLGASSFISGVRFQNTRSMEQYLMGKRKKEQVEPLSREDAMEEFMFLGMRCMAGVSAEDFRQQFGTEMESVYGKVLTELEKQGLTAREGDRFFLTKRGIDVSNYVFAQFLL